MKISALVANSAKAPGETGGKMPIETRSWDGTVRGTAPAV